MKSLFIFLLLFFCWTGQAQDSTRCFSFDKKTEKKVELLREKMNAGEFTEAEALFNPLKRKYKNNPFVLFQIELLKAEFNYQQLAYLSSENNLNESLSLLGSITEARLQATARLLLTEYYLQHGRTKEAGEVIKASSIPSDSAFQIRYALNRIEFLIQSGAHSDAFSVLETIPQQSTTFYANAFVKEQYSKEFSLKMWAKGKLLQLQLLHAFGDDARFTKQLSESRKEIQKVLGKSHPVVLELYSLEGIHQFSLHKYNSASNAFFNAYSFDIRNDALDFKINQLKWMVLSFLKSGDVIHSQQYARRLLMLATQKSGYSDRYQLAYNIVYSSEALWNGDLDIAKARLDKTKESFNNVPAFSPEWKEIKALEQEISLKEGNVSSYLRLLNALKDSTSSMIGASSSRYHQAMLEIAMAELRYGKNFTFIKETFQKSYDQSVRKEIEPISLKNLEYLNAYAQLYKRLDLFDSARVKAAIAVRIAGTLFERKGPAFAYCMSNFTEYCLLSGNYKHALDSMAVLQTLKLNSGEAEDQQNAMLAITGLYNQFGEYGKSSSLLADANRAAKSDFYERNVTLVAESASKQAAIYILSGNYFKAEKVLTEALQQVSKTLGAKSPLLIPIYEELISLNITTGNFSECGTQLEKTRVLIDSVYGTKGLSQSEYLVRNGDYLIQISDIKGAEKSYKSADALVAQLFGKKHLKRSETLLRLAYLQTLKQGSKVSEVEALYNEALDIIKQSIGVSNPLYAETQERYAQLLIKNSNWDKAQHLLTEADNFWNQKLGSNNAHSTNIAVLKGDIQYAKMQYSDAEKNYQSARKNYKDLFNDTHPSYLKVSGKLARTNFMKGEANQALSIMDDIIPKYLEFTNNYFPSLSFRQKSKFWNNLKEEFEFYNAIVFSRPALMVPLYTGKVYNNVLNTKALLLSSSIKLLEKILNSNDSTLIAKYNQWVAEKEFLVNAMNLSKQSLQEQGINLSDIEANVERLEKEMAQRSELFASENDKEIPTWLKVKSSLMQGEAAIEIIRYRTFNKTFTDSVCYAALIVHNDKLKLSPDYVLMGNGKQMEGKYLKYYRNCSVFDTPDEFSYSIYWKMIKSKLKDNELVYLSSDGVYNQINLEMLPDSSGKYIIDQNQLVLLTNTRDLITSAKQKNKDAKKKISDRFVLCGSPEFYTDKTTPKNVQDLPGAEKEINEIHALLAISSRDSWKLLNAQVEEDTIKKLVSPKVLHIATHGYFKDAKSDALTEDDITTNPLLNSGILLRGSGDILDNKSNSYVNQKDGILTALEAMDMNLDKTDLVILSACETGRGSVQAGEGVYGLQRAFLLAGSKAVVISLFKVNDEVTQKLMLSFYTKWLATGDKRQAFVDAKREIKETYHKPVNWGAFIMIEGKPDRVMKN